MNQIEDDDHLNLQILNLD